MTLTHEAIDRAVLGDLIERVEKAVHGNRELDVLIECATNGGGYDYATDHRPSQVRGKVVARHKNGGRIGTYNAPDYSLSVDTALALCERMLLPGQWTAILDDAHANMWQRSAPVMALGDLPVANILALLRSLHSAGGQP